MPDLFSEGRSIPDSSGGVELLVAECSCSDESPCSYPNRIGLVAWLGFYGDDVAAAGVSIIQWSFFVFVV